MSAPPAGLKAAGFRPGAADAAPSEAISFEVLSDPAGVPRARAMLQRAEWAARAFARYDKQAMDRIVHAAAQAGAAKAREYAEWAVRETGFGVADHKVVKNLACTTRSTVCLSYRANARAAHSARCSMARARGTPAGSLSTSKLIASDGAASAVPGLTAVLGPVMPGSGRCGRRARRGR